MLLKCNHNFHIQHFRRLRRVVRRFRHLDPFEVLLDESLKDTMALERCPGPHVCLQDASHPGPGWKHATFDATSRQQHPEKRPIPPTETTALGTQTLQIRGPHDGEKWGPPRKSLGCQALSLHIVKRSLDCFEYYLVVE